MPQTCLVSTTLWLTALLCILWSPAAYSQVQATAQPLNLPSAIAYDADGNLYIAETGNHLVRKVDSAGNITTVAGNGTQGFSGDGGAATLAQLDSPQGVAVDGKKHLYIADTHNHRVRSVDLNTGTITTVVGTVAGFSGDNGPASAARLDLPMALAVDGADNLYIADSRNYRVRKLIASTGLIVTVAGNGTQGFAGDNGPAIAASIDSPTGLAIDAAGNLYIADTHNHRVRKVAAATGIITTIAGNGSSGFAGDNSLATAGSLALPHGLALDRGGNLYIADAGNNRIRRVDAQTETIITMTGNGTQNFAGDTGPAAEAALDTPRALALAPSGLLATADSHNQRVRQMDTQSASYIYTIAGLAPITPGTLQLAASPAIIYGSGQITASLAPGTNASGKVTFTLLTPETATVSESLTANAASFDTQTLAAGQYTIIASYAGDSAHASVQSSPLNFRIDPRPLTAVPNSVTLLYGQAIPVLTGSIAGMLPQDSDKLNVSFATPATNASSAGAYPVSASITGAAAKNYVVSATPASLTIKAAPTVVTLTTSAASIASGTSLTASAHVISTTTGVPAGAVTLLDGTTPIATLPASAGTASFTVGQLAAGTHTLTASYAGDKNFLASASTPALITVTPAPSNSADFTIASTQAISQTIAPGGTASFSFAVQTQGTGLSSPIKLAASGLPPLTTASFNPEYLPPGTGAGTFVLTISTPKSALVTHKKGGAGILFALLLFPYPGIFLWRKHRQRTFAAILLIFVTCLVGLSGCGSRVFTGNQPEGLVKTYNITVTGTATSPSGGILQHSTTVKLIVQSAS
ncbi:MAG TPA: Ig-like domain repeat protein [Edaphobacter sp.]|nr:Ig-like domain repeat protein [Edaphobacter sp.]